MFSRWGNPKEMLETPKEVYAPNSSRMSCNAFKVTAAASCSALMVMASTSNIKSVFGIPYVSAVAMIFFATSKRPSAVGGMPFSSKVKAITTPPYFFTSGNTSCMECSFPFTELINGFPL